MHYLPFGDRLNKGILMVTQLIKGFRRFFIFTKKQQKRKNHKFPLANSPSANGI